MRDVKKRKLNFSCVAPDVIQHDVHRVVADIVAGMIGTANLPSKLEVESSR